MTVLEQLTVDNVTPKYLELNVFLKKIKNREISNHIGKINITSRISPEVTHS